MSRTVASGALLGLLTVAVERGLSFLVLVLVARGLGTGDFGVFVYVLAGIMPLQVMADQGIEVAAVKLMAGRTRGQGAIVTASLLLRLVLWVVVALPVAVWVLPAWGGSDVATSVAASMLVLVGPSLPYRSLYRAREEMPRVWLIAALDAGGGLLAVLVVLAAGAGIAGVFAARATASLVVTLWCAQHAPVRLGLAGLRRRTARALLRGGWPLALNALLLTLMVRLGHLVVMRVLDASAVGHLGAASRVAEVLSLIPEGVMMAVFPVMAARRRRAGAVASETSARLSMVALWAIVVCTVGAEPILGLLFGDAFEGGAGALRILCWSGLTSATGAVVLYRLISEERQRLLLVANAGAVGVGLVLQLMLVEAAGIEGAAVATVATLVVGQLFLLIDPAGREAIASAWRAALRPILLAVGVLGALVLVDGVWLPVLAAAVLYPIGAWLAGILTAEDLRLFRRALGQITR